MKIRCTYSWHQISPSNNTTCCLVCFTKWLQSYGTHKHILWIQEHNFMCKMNFSSIRNNLEFEIFDLWGFPVTAGLQLFREPCQPSRKSCWEARRRARHIDPPVASSCLFTNNKSMQHSAGGCHAWPPICSEHSHTHAHKHCIEYIHTHTQAERQTGQLM